MSGFSFSKAAGLQQQPKGEVSKTNATSKSKQDGGSSHVNDLHSQAAAHTGNNSTTSMPSQFEAQKQTDADSEEAIFWKDKGNLAYRAGKWEVAAEAYSRSVTSVCASMP